MQCLPSKTNAPAREETMWVNKQVKKSLFAPETLQLSLYLGKDCSKDLSHDLYGRASSEEISKKSLHKNPWKNLHERTFKRSIEELIRTL